MMKKQASLLLTFAWVFTFSLVGCGTSWQAKTQTQPNTGVQATSGDVAKVLSTSYDKSTGTININVRKIRNATGEDIVDINGQNGIINFATTRYPNANVRIVRVNTPVRTFTISVPPDILKKNQPASMVGSSVASAMVATGNIPAPPPGARIDKRIQPIAGISSSDGQKQNAVMKVAKSKLGTPYVWGHNEDRGQFGFDCSNFTEYVYHHALGYKISGSSQVQYHSVGVPVSKNNMQTGDLVIFERGGHVGIYAGSERVIECGGGLKKVGYLKINRGSYWGNRITVIKRLF
jgi:cell wall-associated NlpC family hydrolase